MIVLGVILILLAVAAGLVFFAGTSQLTDTVDIDILGGTLSFPPLALLITGMVVITVFWFGWFLLRSGMRRNRRQRAQAKEDARLAEEKRLEDEKRTKEEFAARERQLVEERRRHEEERAALLKEADARQAGSTPQATTARQAGTTPQAGAGQPTDPAPTPDGGRTDVQSPTAGGRAASPEDPSATKAKGPDAPPA